MIPLPSDLPIDIELILGGLAMILGVIIHRYRKQYLIFKQKYERLLDVLNTIEEALEDDQITKEELKTIYQKLKKLIS